MPKWTKEQLDAINKCGTNIIVSAGAGSGKTAVLTERVITKLGDGIKINELLILTFTNAAASEMKERIRKKISDIEELKDNLDYLDSAYITTFDSYTLSLIKKYNYLLNVSPNLSIIDQSIISIYKKDLLDKIFDKYYQDNNSLFNKFINDFAIKNDTLIKNSLLKIISSIDLISNKEDFLNNYFDNYLSDEKIKLYLKKYMELLRNEIDSIESNLMYISNLDSDSYEVLYSLLDSLIRSNSYDDIKKNINIALPKKVSEEVSSYKKNINESLKTLKYLTRFSNEEEIIESLSISKNYITVIISIIKDFYDELNNYKFKNDLYEFTDLSILAIKLLKMHPNILEEVRNSFKEILVDEYQDTSDLQEEFISLIQNNNVYMVGDIKQSIYGFRNANPIIFKEKYDFYSNNNGGLKIDLLKNFRSRKEVLNAINEIFSRIMDDTIGGCDYIKTHQMIFGNTLYDEYSANDNYNVEIYNYHSEDKNFSKEETEAFIIAKDIKNKINNNYKVIDKDTFTIRDCRYEDFCIIMDRGNAFPIYKKIFEYLNIPLNIYEDKKLTNEIDIKLISNIIELILKIKDNIFDTAFKYDFISILRSYLFSYSDEEILNIVKNNSYKDTPLYKIIENIIKEINLLNSVELLNRVINDFNIIEKTILVGNIDNTIIRIDNLKNIARNLSELGYSIKDFNNYLKEMIDGTNEITYKGINNSSNTVKIMNIHKSKGLEFPICYYSGLYKGFNTTDIKARFVYDKEYGIITPYFKEGIDNTILKDLLKEKYAINNTSEEIRLFYVALTRCKEKMIIVASINEDTYNSSRLVDYSIRSKYNSFLSILNSINGLLDKYIYNVNLDDYNMTKDYLKSINNNFKDFGDTNKKITYESINISNELIINKHASKDVSEILTNEDIKKMEYGTLMHKVFEETDFLNIPDDEYSVVLNDLKNKLNITNNTKIYKEHEFMYEENNTTYHGIIDLVLVEKDIIKIVDYKLKNIDDPKYIEQLRVYHNYLKTIFNKDIKVYLYSIMNNELKEIQTV